MESLVEWFVVAVMPVAVCAGCIHNCEDIYNEYALSAVMKDAKTGESICSGNIYAQRSSDEMKYPFQSNECVFIAYGTGISAANYTIVANAPGYKTTIVRNIETELEEDKCQVKPKRITIELERELT